MANDVPKGNRANGLPEIGDPKYDVARMRIGAMDVCVNVHQAALTPRNTVFLVIAIAVGIGASFGVYLALYSLSSKFARFCAPVVFGGFVWSAARTLAGLHWNLARHRELALLPRLKTLGTSGTTEAVIALRGRPSEILKFAELNESGFEPRLFRTAHYALGMKLELRVFTAMCAVSIAVWQVVAHPLFRALPMVGLLALPLFYLMVRGIPRPPVYYRLIPGRLDRLAYGFLRSKPVAATSVVLRDAPVYIDLTARKEFVRIGFAGGPVEFRRDRFSDPLGFALAVAQARLSRAETPPIPMDELLG